MKFRVFWEHFYLKIQGKKIESYKIFPMKELPSCLTERRLGIGWYFHMSFAYLF
jgi:hypothetical protein